MRSPLADEEELLRLVQAGLSQAKIAEAKGVSRQAVGQRLKALEPRLHELGIEVQRERQSRSQWVPWRLGTSRWRHHITMKMLRLLGRRFDGPELTEDEDRQLQAFLDKLDRMPQLRGGRGVVTYRGPDIGIRIVARDPWDRGYVRWPADVPDTRPMPPELVMPDEPYTDPHELKLWALTDLPREERHARILVLRSERAARRGAREGRKTG
jgi:transcriptional regulator with XRE-family HTH domain